MKSNLESNLIKYCFGEVEVYKITMTKINGFKQIDWVAVTNFKIKYNEDDVNYF